MSENAQLDPSNLPRPTPSAETQRFWDDAKNSILSLQKCKNCGKFHFPPSRFCSHCFSEDCEWVAVSGKGVVHSFTIIHRANQRDFLPPPYAVAVIELAEGPRFVSNVITDRLDLLRCGAAVEVYFDRVKDGFSAPRFRPSRNPR